MFLVGPNASGKSNFLDAFRFLIANQTERIAEFETDFPVNDLESLVEALVAWSQRELADRVHLVAEYELILRASRDEPTSTRDMHRSRSRRVAGSSPAHR